MSISESLAQVLREPTSAGMWRLRGDLLATGLEPDARAARLLTKAYRFFTALAAKSTAREYSHFASLLDIGAVGVVVLTNFSESVEEGENLFGSLMTAALSEGFMVMAARQYVKAWEEEMQSVYQTAAWELYGELWQLSQHMQPELSAEERRLLLDSLLQPVTEQEAPGTVRAMIIGRLYQLLLLIHLRHEAL